MNYHCIALPITKIKILGLFSSKYLANHIAWFSFLFGHPKMRVAVKSVKIAFIPLIVNETTRGQLWKETYVFNNNSHFWVYVILIVFAGFGLWLSVNFSNSSLNRKPFLAIHFWLLIKWTEDLGPGLYMTYICKLRIFLAFEYLIPALLSSLPFTVNQTLYKLFYKLERNWAAQFK